MSTFPKSLRRALTLLIIAGIAAIISGCASREERIQSVQIEANEALFADRSDLAIEILSEGLDSFPDSNELRIALARALQNAGKLEEAAAHFEEAVRFDPEADQLWVKIGEIRASLGQSQAAVTAFESYLKNHAGDFLAWKAVALENEKLGKLTDAIKAAGKWNEITPSSQPALKLGELYLASRNTAQARSWFSQAAAYGDDGASKDALAELIKLETSLKQFQQATIWLTQYGQRYGSDLSDPRIQESKTVLDSWDRARREIAAAAAELEKEREELEAQRIAEEEAAAKRQAEQLANTVAAQQPTEPNQNEAAPKPAPGDAPAQKLPFALFDDEGDPPANTASTPPDGPAGPAEKGNSLALSPYEQAISAFEAGNYNEAISLYWELLGNNDNDPQVWYRLSQAYYALGNWYDAENTILQAKSRAPRSEVIANQYLQTLIKTQNTTRVLEEIKALRLLFPQSPAIALTLAQTLRNANAPRSIIAAAYRDFMSIAPRGAPGYEEAKQYLQNGN
ncbi:tetratricopeptide repeat protein [Pelagicoccus sp. SDUM812005]|uniref:tetratricopeptide repeat protein n=1 Tax=Pelagicoccus sp. SDUM812005 TaxID=3041257 RepID=UPI00280DB13A|nr:tetratricopeptide repeat protein [Pelagicoccus sp. SDUM812005]MDQ8180129.1 tetratricopeptide repeat protein [Pelagicoccus sp. SDUM812005]